ncbi:MAG: efflux transporter, family, subunit [Myxococcales bacterium]|nr:efflux transporter, family, subunit [Myxococcales bacterium]
MSRRWLHILGTCLLIVAVVVVGLLYLHRKSVEMSAIAARKHAISRGPTVMVKKVLPGGGSRHISLPGEARAFLSTTVYAKLPGYLREIRVDKGQRVKKDEVLAVVFSPESNQDVRAAETDLNLRRQVATRTNSLAQVGVMSRQDREVADAQLRTSMATLRRTRDIQGYQVIRAPFAGQVTARYADPGALIPAATGSTQAAQPIVDLADTGRLRITVYFGQDAAPSVHVGDKAVIWTNDQPTRRMETRISLASGQIEPRTRTMLAELWFDNRAVGILPGTFVHVDLDIAEPAIPTVPNAAIIVRAGHLRAAVVEGNKLHFVPIEVGASDGNRTQVTQGLKPGDLVANDVPAELGDGAVIQPMLQ